MPFAFLFVGQCQSLRQHFVVPKPLSLPFQPKKPFFFLTGGTRTHNEGDNTLCSVTTAFATNSNGSLCVSVCRPLRALIMSHSMNILYFSHKVLTPKPLFFLYLFRLVFSQKISSCLVSLSSSWISAWQRQNRSRATSVAGRRFTCLQVKN